MDCLSIRTLRFQFRTPPPPSFWGLKRPQNAPPPPTDNPFFQPSFLCMCARTLLAREIHLQHEPGILIQTFMREILWFTPILLLSKNLRQALGQVTSAEARQPALSPHWLPCHGACPWTMQSH